MYKDAALNIHGVCVHCSRIWKTTDSIASEYQNSKWQLSICCCSTKLSCSPACDGGVAANPKLKPIAQFRVPTQWGILGSPRTYICLQIKTQHKLTLAAKGAVLARGIGSLATNWAWAWRGPRLTPTISLHLLTGGEVVVPSLKKNHWWELEE